MMAKKATVMRLTGIQCWLMIMLPRSIWICGDEREHEYLTERNNIHLQYLI